MGPLSKVLLGHYPDYQTYFYLMTTVCKQNYLYYAIQHNCFPLIFCFLVFCFWHKHKYTRDLH